MARPLTLERVWAGLAVVYNLQTFPLFAAYITMIVLSGQWRKFSKPLSLRPVLVVYNFTASAISLYTLVGFFVGLYNAESSFGAYSDEQLRPVFRIYWLTKIFELLDTVFMILRHKSRQISLLHVYHHGSMLLLSDIAYHLFPYPAMTSYLGLNSAVHVVLYMYYGLSALYPENPPEWKKFLTQFQIVQFAIDLVHATYGYIYHTYCIYGIFYGLSMFCLFSNFYYRAYIKTRNQSKNQKADNVSNGVCNGVNGIKSK
ncbi:elongation of very long chain fatty acids protein 5-like [Mya arenaria]|uniref:elongation of very long chain fatty acids protein 5-like n=1 Tax=Mya arenaria TaxID=6604 RepID=UPI0022E85050|nr:elongation of very long chain fatty acids protein 5-like [Mya arenaria]XP_052782007.1 elongation of very long chain fatty acids protein 5-like [Mya arenaria]XP_052782016.1 elongation of very long chain fatty acids protein 5-like [Mya arenaria]XP_052782025.1 elongation of very long chain fatty acids protein 5-like [Mya arenaria]XP_052782031.1 elongation of very long chain fatty acids protein 5-like [Mya arenaria]